LGVALAALIIAQDGEGQHQESAALLPLLGQTVIEFQARQAHNAGATHIIICAAQLPAGLVSAVDRLRGEGINATFARNARDAAESIHPDEDVLLFAEGAIASTARLAELAASRQPKILVRGHTLETAHLELIDGDHVWAGVARIDGALTRKTAAILGEWALAPTLLRMAVQENAGRVALADPAEKDVLVVRNSQSARQAASYLLEKAAVENAGAFSRYVADPVARLAAEAIGRTALPYLLVALLPLVIMLGALGLAAFWWIKTALAAFLLAAIPAEAARRLGDASLQSAKPLNWYFAGRPWVGRGLILLSAYWLTALGASWGCLALAAWLVWQLATRAESVRAHASEESSALILLVGLMSGFPVTGIIAALLSTLIAPLVAQFRPKTAA
jgi:hypothetical protein